MVYSGVLLDLDNTLYDYQSAHGPAFASVMGYYAKLFKLPEEDLAKAYMESREAINDRLRGTAASHNRLLYFQGMCERLGIHPVPHALESHEMYWDLYIDNAVLEAGVEDFFMKCRGASVALLTDLTADVQYRKIHRLGLERHIDYVVTSEEAGKEKPDPEMFHLALAKMKLVAEDVCMIGDNYEKDMAGAVALNIRGFWVNKENESRPAHPLVTELRSFKDVIECL
jgi:putative hydrolase of the HAD superfamily